MNMQNRPRDISKEAFFWVILSEVFQPEQLYHWLSVPFTPLRVMNVFIRRRFFPPVNILLDESAIK